MTQLNLFGIQLTTERIRQAVIGFFVLVLAYNLGLGQLGGFGPEGSTWLAVEAYMAKRGEVEKQQTEIDASRALVGTREQTEVRLVEVRKSLRAIQGRFPLRNQILSILLVDLSAMFRDTGTSLSNFEPLGFKPLEQGNLKDLGRMQIKITARGDYPSIILLFDRLARYERVLRIEAPQLGPGADSAPAAPAADGTVAAENAVAPAPSTFNRTLNVSFTLNTYALNR